MEMEYLKESGLKLMKRCDLDVDVIEMKQVDIRCCTKQHNKHGYHVK
jgi:hypothetical protein